MSKLTVPPCTAWQSQPVGQTDGGCNFPTAVNARAAAAATAAAAAAAAAPTDVETEGLNFIRLFTATYTTTEERRKRFTCAGRSF